MNTFELALDLDKRAGVTQWVTLRQGDKSGTTLRATIYDHGTQVGSGYTCRVSIRHPGTQETYYRETAEYANGVATVTIDERYAASVVGITSGYFELLEGDAVIASTADFGVRILRSATDGAVPGEVYDSAIEEALAELDEATGHVAQMVVDATEEYLEAHPEITTTVQDGAVTMKKLADDVLDELDAKAYSDGYYAQLTAGAADNLTGRGDPIGAEYLYRTTAGTASVSDEAEATIKSIHGNTLRWNQMRKPSDGNSSTTVNGIAFTKNDDGSVVVSGTATSKATIYLKNFAAGELVSDHKYLVIGCCPAGGSNDTYFGGIAGQRTDIGNGGIWVGNITVATTLRFTAVAGATVPETTLWPQFFDLTAMFGAGNEPTTAAEFEALYPLPYYPYDAGSLLPVRMEGIETVGFNQFDASTAVNGEIWNATGGTSVNTSCYRSPLIEVFPNTDYYTNAYAQGTVFTVRYFDADKALIGSSNLASAGVFTTPANCRYVGINSITAKVPPSELVLNLSWSGYRNGEHEAYWQQQRLIDVSTYFPDGMRSAGSVADELTETAAIVRVGSVDLGTLTWTESPTVAGLFNSSTISDIATTPNSSVASIKCARYQTYSGNSVDSSTAGISGGLNNSKAVCVHDPVYAGDAAALKAALSGVMLYYALATPTTTPIDPPLNMDYRYSDFGTERVMVPEGEMSAPPSMQVVYGINATDTIRNLPTDYVSAKSFRNYLAAKDAHEGTTTTMTWDEGQQAYTFAITTNGGE